MRLEVIICMGADPRGRECVSACLFTVHLWGVEVTPPVNSQFPQEIMWHWDSRVPLSQSRGETQSLCPLNSIATELSRCFSPSYFTGGISCKSTMWEWCNCGADHCMHHGLMCPLKAFDFSEADVFFICCRKPPCAQTSICQLRVPCQGCNGYAAGLIYTFIPLMIRHGRDGLVSVYYLPAAWGTLWSMLREMTSCVFQTIPWKLEKDLPGKKKKRNHFLLIHSLLSSIGLNCVSCSPPLPPSLPPLSPFCLVLDLISGQCVWSNDHYIRVIHGPRSQEPLIRPHICDPLTCKLMVANDQLLLQIICILGREQSNAPVYEKREGGIGSGENIGG